MARYYQEAKDFANIIKDKNRLKAQIAGLADVVQVGKSKTDIVAVQDFNFVVKTRAVSNDTIWGLFNWGEENWDNSNDGGGFVLGHALMGILGTSELGANEGAWTELSRYKWAWNTTTELNLGTSDANIDVSNGDIRLA